MGGNNSVPLGNNSFKRTLFSLPDQSNSTQKQRSAEFASVSPEFFQVLKTPLLRGRSFTEADTEKSKRVVVVNESFAKQYLSGRDLGQRVNFGTFDWEIVGVVADVRDDGLDANVQPRIYRALYQGTANEMAIFLRGASGSAGLKQAVIQVVQGVDSDLHSAHWRFFLHPSESLASWPMPSPSARKNSVFGWPWARNIATFSC